MVNITFKKSFMTVLIFLTTNIQLLNTLFKKLLIFNVNH